MAIDAGPRLADHADAPLVSYSVFANGYGTIHMLRRGVGSWFAICALVSSRRFYMVRQC
jgi:hypothetical protein